MQAIDAAARVIRVDRYDMTTGEQVKGHGLGVSVNSAGLDECGEVLRIEEADGILVVAVEVGL
jgi:hypothetical protein